MKELVLPAWATVGPEHQSLAIVVHVDTAAAMQEWHQLLGVDKPDQYSIEVAFQCAKMDIQSAISGTEFDPRTSGKSHQLEFSSAPEWALAKHPEGRGVMAATKGREARSHYERVRGSVPFT